MKTFRKYTMLFCGLLLVFSLISCGTSENTAKDSKKEAHPAEKANPAEKNKKIADKEEQPAPAEKNNESAATAASENKTEQKTEKPDSTTQETAANQTNSQTKNAKTASTTHNSGAAAAQTGTSTAGSTAAKPSTTTQPPKPETTVTFSIVGPKDRGTILSPTTVSFKDGDTIYDILMQAAKNKVVARGSGATVYVEGIYNIFEFDYGVKSGWVFKQNGASITKSIGVIKVKDGDRIECFYTE